MLISLLVLSPEQIYTQIWVKHGSLYSGPITPLEPLVVLIGRHKDMHVKRSQTRRERGRGGLLVQGRRIGLEWCAGMVFAAVVPTWGIVESKQKLHLRVSVFAAL